MSRCCSLPDQAASVRIASGDGDLAQIRDNGEPEPAIVTSGDDLEAIQTFLDGRTSYHATDVLAYLQD